MITSSRGLHLNTVCSLFICLLAFVLHLLSRSRERSKEGQRGQPNSIHGRLPPLDSPRPLNLVFTRSCTPFMGLAGAYRYLYFHLFVGAAGPCMAARRARNCTLPCEPHSAVANAPSGRSWLRACSQTEGERATLTNTTLKRAAPYARMQPFFVSQSLTAY